MALPENEWLHKAQALAIGQTSRTYHNEESRANLVIGNDVDRWWAYCHRCHEGGQVQKTHVVVGAEVQVQERFMPWPEDALPAPSSPLYRGVYRTLLGKGIDLGSMLPGVPTYISQRQGRLILASAQGWLGRAIGAVQPKWCAYSNPGQRPAVFAHHPHDRIARRCVVTEDYFSALKIRWTLNDPETTAIAALGTRVHNRLAAALLEADEVLFAFDGDRAGADGWPAAARRLRGLGKSVRICDVPQGLDPKDMQAHQIQEMLQ